MAVLNTSTWNDDAGAPVVCVHGVTSHAGRFRELAGRLDGARVVSVDLRGHGRSTWDAPWTVETHLGDLLETADAHGIGAATWIGHSFGGRLVAELAARNPDRVERAVLLDPAMHVPPGDATQRAVGLLGDLTFGSPDEAIDARLNDGTLFTTSRQTLVVEAEEHLERDEDGRYAWRFSPATVIAAWGVMASDPPPWPRCPTLVVIGERSWITNRVPRIANLTSVLVPGGHAVLWDDFDAVAEAVNRFLRA